MPRESINFYEYSDILYNMVGLYLNNTVLGHKDSYNYYDIDVDKILLSKKSYGEYVIRYNDVNKMTIAQLQLKINNFYRSINTFRNNNRVMFIYNDDKEFFRKCREIWNKIIELIDTNNASDFVTTNSDDDEVIMADVHKNTSFVEGNYKSKLVIVLHSTPNDYPKTSLVQVKT